MNPAEIRKAAEELNASRAEVLETELASRSWKDFDVVERKGRPLFLDSVQRRNLATGAWEKTPLRFGVPNEMHLRRALARAHEIAAESKLDPKQSPLAFDNLEAVCTVQLSLFSPTEPYEPFANDEEDLQIRLGRPQIEQAYRKLEGFKSLLDPAPADISEGEMIAVSFAIAKEQSLRPLYVFGGHSQTKYVLTLVALHLGALAEKSSKPSSSPSPLAV